MKLNKIILSCISATIILIACNGSASTDKKDGTAADKGKEPGIKIDTLTYKAAGAVLTNYVAYDSAVTGKRPAILVVHEWWGLNDYIQSRIKKLAALGYIAIAVDMYGDGKKGETPDSAGKLAMPFYKDPALAKARFDAALDTIKGFAQTDTNNIAAIGYCFGGAMVLNVARMGEKLNGVVSFHGGLVGVPPVKDLLKAKVLVCHGGDDKFVNQKEVDQFKKQMDSIGADYKFIVYPGATHAFTNPNATAMGQKFNIPIAYNAAADSSSWKDMQSFFGKIFK